MTTPNQSALLEVRDVSISYDAPSGSGKERFIAVHDASLELRSGEILGVVGQSGSGKSTLVKAVLGMAHIDSGTVIFGGKDVTNARGKQLRELYRHVQMVFQSPHASFDPRRTLGYSAMEGLRNVGVAREEAHKRVSALFVRCGLDKNLMDRYPSDVSGGQCQRVAIVRALALKPSLLICDEATSALDTLAQAQIVRLIRELRDERGMGVLFVCHDLALAQELCDEVVVMHEGRIVERGNAREVMAHPNDPCTQLLVESARAVSL